MAEDRADVRDVDPRTEVVQRVDKRVDRGKFRRQQPTRSWKDFSRTDNRGPLHQSRNRHRDNLLARKSLTRLHFHNSLESR